MFVVRGFGCKPQDWREAGAGRYESQTAEETFESLAEFASSLDNSDLFMVSRAFTHFLALANAAEGHHRSRILLQQTDHGAFASKNDSCFGVLPQLLEEHDADTVFKALTTQVVELVLTAHPTEVNRRTILDKQRRVQQVNTR